MARVADEPTPSPGRAFGRSLRHLAIRDALAALMTAWRLAFEPTSPVSTSTRASAAGLFLAVVIVVGVGGAFVASGALTFLGSDGPAAGQLAPAASPVQTPAVAEEPTPSPEPSPSLEPTPSPATTPTPPTAPSVSGQDRDERGKREKRETPEPEEREDRKKRETPEPKEREREEDEKDEKDEEDEEDDD